MEIRMSRYGSQGLYACVHDYVILDLGPQGQEEICLAKDLGKVLGTERVSRK